MYPLLVFVASGLCSELTANRNVAWGASGVESTDAVYYQTFDTCRIPPYVQFQSDVMWLEL